MKPTRLEQLLPLAFSIRAVGHTHAEIEGVRNTPNAILIVADHSRAQDLNSFMPNKVMSIETALNILPGCHKPIVIDHYALLILVEEHTRAYRDRILELNSKMELLMHGGRL